MAPIEKITVGDVEWSIYEGFEAGQVLFQRKCAADCDNGLVYSPVRHCLSCGGSGYNVTQCDPRANVEELTIKQLTELLIDPDLKEGRMDAILQEVSTNDDKAYGVITQLVLAYRNKR